MLSTLDWEALAQKQLAQLCNTKARNSGKIKHFLNMVEAQVESADEVVKVS